MNKNKTAAEVYADIISMLFEQKEKRPKTLAEKIENSMPDILQGKQVLIKNVDVIHNPGSFVPGDAPVQMLQDANMVTAKPWVNDILAYIPMSLSETSYLHTIDETARTVSAGTRKENDPMQQSDRTYTEVTYKPTHISSYMDVSAETLEDATFLRNEIMGSLRSEGRQALADQVLNGDGVSPNMKGLFSCATTFAAGPFAGNVVSATYNDVLKVAQYQIMQEKYTPTVAVVNPQDYTTMNLGYNSMTDFDFTILASTLVPVDQYLLFDANVTRLYIVTDELVFSEQNQDNVLKNQITVIYNTSTILKVSSIDYPAIVKGVFSDDLTTITPTP
jgi:hypothetical protein